MNQFTFESFASSSQFIGKSLLTKKEFYKINLCVLKYR
ncbi:hypothetical protein BHF72_2370 [Cloacibacterium normanense]|uniref:Uncharacterized protein n=1 Tax=Cloacibacterium normanense TaxID=237258 RepID=A0A1E5UE22_9FLAO|nr:hypothetical protein BHF72_2370 [Cloacibacterium normanense]